MIRQILFGTAVAIITIGVAVSQPSLESFAIQEAERGDLQAQTALGIMYRDGRGGASQNHPEALRWFRKAAEQGYASAQNNLGGMYYEGKGVTQDDVLAHMWWNLAAAQGNEEARINRDMVGGLMTKDQIAEAQRLAREWKPSRR